MKRALGAAVVPEGTLIAFAAGPGRRAAAFLEKDDPHSPFTRFLTDGIRGGGGDLLSIVNAATRVTKERTEGRQVPHVEVRGDISLISGFVLGTGMGVTKPEVGNSTSESPELAAMKAQLEEANRKLAAAEKRKGKGRQTPPAAAPMATTTPVPAPAFPASRGMEGSRAGEVREFGGIEMVWCPAGEFMMGSPAGEEGRSEGEKPHLVTLTRGFWLAKTECTQGQWESVIGENPSEFKGADLPVENVTWDDVQGWLAKMNGKHPLPAGWRWELPTEAQWEYACRAGTETVFSFGNVLNGTQANCDGDLPYGTSAKGPYLDKTRPVGNYEANGLGLHDMHGNVFEWCLDYFGEYARESATDPKGADSGEMRVSRGGSWYCNPLRCRSASRFPLELSFRSSLIGFRPAAVPAGR